ncbi:hypothetical protein DFJ74DRAFT_684718 [Hyaloraphidium curvatum]|nr:hypothetical protein DFJ74DRAFT_684718 [Hyaloraphidium curvatum]
MLSSRGASATFFVIGSYLANNPQARELLKRAHDEGHCIADHTMLHPDMTSIPIERARSEILETADRIKGVIGRYPRLFRFPFGSSNQALLDLAAELGFASIGWNVDPQDWQEISQDEYRGYLREGLGWFEQYGYVSITHDYKSSAPGILRSLFEEIDARKLQIVDAQTCFAMPCYAD